MDCKKKFPETRYICDDPLMELGQDFGIVRCLVEMSLEDVRSLFSSAFRHTLDTLLQELLSVSQPVWLDLESDLSSQEWSL